MLAAKVVGPSPLAAAAAAVQTVYVLHGLLGSARNWHGFVTSLAAEVPATRFVLLDLRNHGGSQGLPPPHTLDACVDDVLAYAGASLPGDAPAAMIGHSMGGKVLLQLASRHADAARLAAASPSARLRLVVLDSLPGARAPDAAAAAATDSVARVLRVVEEGRSHVPSKAWVMERCAAAGIERGVAAWLASSVARLDGGHHGEAAAGGAGGRGDALRWAFDPDTAAALYASYLDTDRWDVLERGPPPAVALDVVIASRSSRWRDADTRARLAAATAAAAARPPAAGGAVTFSTIDAGHWLHVDNPTALRALLATKLLA